MSYYLKAAAIIARHPIRFSRHPRRMFILGCIKNRGFRLHWLRDIVREG